MAIGDAIMFVGCLAGFMVALPALLIVLSLMLNRTTYAAAERLHRGVWLPLIMGIVAFFVVAVPASILISLGSVFQLMGVILWLFLLTWTFTGWAALARMLGGRLSLMAERRTSSMTEAVIGALMLSFAIAFPFVGWFVLIPVCTMMGIGGTVIAFRSGNGDNTTPMADAT